MCIFREDWPGRRKPGLAMSDAFLKLHGYVLLLFLFRFCTFWVKLIFM